MKINEIRELTTEELKTQITDLKTELFDLRMKQATGGLDKTHKINELRKTVARMKTVLNEKDGSVN